MVLVTLFETKNESQLEERLEAIKSLCKKWMRPGPTEHEAAISDFNEIYSMIRNIELSDLPLHYHKELDYKSLGTTERKVAPQVGDTIVIDCGHTVEVIHVSHQRDETDRVQVMTRRVEEFSGELNDE